MSERHFHKDRRDDDRDYRVRVRHDFHVYEDVPVFARDDDEASHLAELDAKNSFDLARLSAENEVTLTATEVVEIEVVDA